MTYSDRHIEMQTVKSIETYKNDGGAVTGSSGWTAGCSAEVLANLTVGAEYGVEMKGGPFGIICGWLISGVWYDRKTDEQIAQDFADWREQRAQEKRDSLAKYRAEWIGREENLPGWLKDRIHTFHEKGGEEFELDGWGYELVVCEVAALYAASGGVDDDAVNAYSREHGTSGNQHDMAKALAAAHARGQSLAGTVSALSPLTGSAFYEADPS